MSEKTEVAPAPLGRADAGLTGPAPVRPPAATSAAQARAPEPPPQAPQMLVMNRPGEAPLPQSVQWILGRVPREEWRYVQTLLCRLPITRDIVNVVQFGDTVWGLARNAEFRTTDRITGLEMDQFREELDAAVKMIVSVTARLAKRAGLTEILQRQRRLIRRWGCDVNSGEGRSPEAGGAPPVKTAIAKVA